MRRTEDEKLRRKMHALRGVRSVAEEVAMALPQRCTAHAATCTAILSRFAEREAGVKESYKRKSSIALGIVVIALVSIMETWMVDHRMPNPASPIVWSVLGATAAIAFGFFCWFRAKAKQAPD